MISAYSLEIVTTSSFRDPTGATRATRCRPALEMQVQTAGGRSQSTSVATMQKIGQNKRD